MKLPKLRITWGNCLAMATFAAGLVKEAAPQLVVLLPGSSQKLLAVAAVLALVTKGAASWNHDAIPDEKKAEKGPVLFEKTGPLAPLTPSVSPEE